MGRTACSRLGLPEPRCAEAARRAVQVDVLQGVLSAASHEQWQPHNAVTAAHNLALRNLAVIVMYHKHQRERRRRITKVGKFVVPDVRAYDERCALSFRWVFAVSDAAGSRCIHLYLLRLFFDECLLSLGRLLYPGEALPSSVWCAQTLPALAFEDVSSACLRTPLGRGYVEPVPGVFSLLRKACQQKGIQRTTVKTVRHVLERDVSGRLGEALAQLLGVSLLGNYEFCSSWPVLARQRLALYRQLGSAAGVRSFVQDNSVLLPSLLREYLVHFSLRHWPLYAGLRRVRRARAVCC